MQPVNFAFESCYKQFDKLGDLLPKLSVLVDWESFRSLLSRIRQKERKSSAGRKPYDIVLMFKILCLQSFYGFGDDHDQTEYQIHDRYSFCRFLGLQRSLNCSTRVTYRISYACTVNDRSVIRAVGTRAVKQPEQQHAPVIRSRPS